MAAELYKPFKTMFSVFKLVGMWQDGNQSWTYFILGYFIHFSFIELCLLGELICAYHDESLVDLIETLGLTFTYIAEMLKCWNFFLKLKIIQKAFETLTELVEFSADERLKNREHLKSEIAFGFKVFKIFWASAWTTCFASALVPFTSDKLPYKVWFPFDTQTSSLGFWGASIYLIVNSFVVSVVDISLDTLPVFFMVFAIGLTNELLKRLQAIGKIQNSPGAAEEFKKCIEIHWKIQKLVKEIQKIFSSVILVQGFFSSLILCMGTFSMSTVSFVSILFPMLYLFLFIGHRRHCLFSHHNTHDSDASRDFSALLLRQRAFGCFIKAFNCFVPLRLDELRQETSPVNENLYRKHKKGIENFSFWSV
jgi:hypothetical protein